MRQSDRSAPDPARRRPRPGVGSRGLDSGSRHDRLRIAQSAARIIVEHGLVDWSAAKRKAARQLLLPESASLPSNDEVELALGEYQSLFGGDAHARSLRAQRLCALEWMHRLERFAPLLVGGVAAGWAGAHHDIRLELVADDPKSVELALAGGGIRYRGLACHPGEKCVDLLIEEPDRSLRLSILSINDRRQRPKSDLAVRLDEAMLQRLVGGG
jgi:hypothetical protein